MMCGCSYLCLSLNVPCPVKKPLLQHLSSLYLGCDCGIILFKEPTIEREPSPVAPKPTETPIEKKVSPITGRVSVFMSSLSIVIVVGVPLGF